MNSENFNVATGSLTFSDSNGNTWHVLADQANGTGHGSFAYAWDHGGSPLVVGAGHTVSISGGQFTAVVFSAWSFTLSTSTPFDQSSQASASAPGSITPSQPLELVIATVGVQGAQTFTVAGYTLVDSLAFSSGTNDGVGQAYAIQTVATATNPTWGSSGGNISTFAVSFKIAPRPVPRGTVVKFEVREQSSNQATVD